MSLFEDISHFVVCIDVSCTWLECPIMQHWKVVAYDLRELKDLEKNCSTHDLEFMILL